MARKMKTFQIEGREGDVEVKELTVSEILKLMQHEGDDTSLKGFVDMVGEFLPLATNLKMEQLKDMAPSDIKVVWEKFREVNDTFFEVSQQVGMGDLLGQLKKAIIKDFGKLLVSSSKVGMLES